MVSLMHARPQGGALRHGALDRAGAVAGESRRRQAERQPLHRPQGHLQEHQARYDLAYQASQLAVQLRPNDMDLEGKAKNLSALDAMQKGKYQTAKSFIKSTATWTSRRSCWSRTRTSAGWTC